MPAPRRADRSTVRDTTTTVRLSSYQLAAIDIAAARASQAAGRKITRNDLMLGASLRAVAEQGVSVEDPHATLALFETPAPAPASAVVPAVAVTPTAPPPAQPKKKKRGGPDMANVDVVVLPPRRS